MCILSTYNFDIVLPMLTHKTEWILVEMMVDV